MKPLSKCVICGTEFKPRGSRNVCCSNPECKKARDNLTTKIYRLKHPEKTNHKKFVPELKKCEICGAEFLTSKFSGDRQKYCSSECGKKAVAKNNSKRYRVEHPNSKIYTTEEQTYGGERPMTPTLESFFTKLALLLKDD